MPWQTWPPKALKEAQMNQLTGVKGHTNAELRQKTVVCHFITILENKRNKVESYYANKIKNKYIQ